ncbi:hypothetical protein ACFRCG_13130 [Embleya sp. NPDC056575]|uniref:hypothetical protein n=1 Tax=unclassified Embleya TaxID=2699296 RepID=UPI0036C19183
MADDDPPRWGDHVEQDHLPPGEVVSNVMVDGRIWVRPHDGQFGKRNAPAADVRVVRRWKPVVPPGG